MKKQIAIGSIAIASSAILLTGCTNNNNQNINTIIPESEINTQKNNKTEEQNLNANDLESKTANTDSTIDSVKSVKTKLSISSRCIGCGKCTMIDPAHFSSNGRGQKPTVVSQDNLDSSNLQRAIDNCPAGAISIS